MLCEGGEGDLDHKEVGGVLCEGVRVTWINIWWVISTCNLILLKGTHPSLKGSESARATVTINGTGSLG